MYNIMYLKFKLLMFSYSQPQCLLFDLARNYRELLGCLRRPHLLLIIEQCGSNLPSLGPLHNYEDGTPLSDHVSHEEELSVRLETRTSMQVSLVQVLCLLKQHQCLITVFICLISAQ